MNKNANLIMVCQGKEIAFTMTEDELEDIFYHIKGKYGSYQDQSFKSVLDESDDPITESESAKVYFYKVLEVIDPDCFKEKPGFWLIQDNPINDRNISIGSIAIQKFLKKNEAVEGYKAELVGIIEGHTQKDVSRAFDKGWQNGKDWLREHGVTPPGE